MELFRRERNGATHPRERPTSGSLTDILKYLDSKLEIHKGDFYTLS